MKPARSSQSVKSIARTADRSSELPPRRRRQLTQQPPQNANAFAKLPDLARKALTGKF